MKQILLALSVIFLSACNCGNCDEANKSDTYFLNVKGVIEAKSPDFLDRYQVLIRAVPDSAQGFNNVYTTWSYSCYNGKTLDSIWFNKQIGDTVAWEYVRKDRFFGIKRTLTAPANRPAPKWNAQVPIFDVLNGQLVTKNRPIDRERLHEDIIAILHSSDSAEFVKLYCKCTNQ